MKKLLAGFGVFIFSVFAFLISGCSDISSDAYVFDNGTSRVSGNVKSVEFYVSSKSALFSNNLSSSSSAREIAPAAYNSGELNFYLGGAICTTKNQKTDIAVQKVPFTASEDSDSTGIVTAKLDSLTYELTLLAIPASSDTIVLDSDTYISDLISKAVLFGTTTADLKYNNGSQVNFYLSSDSLSGNGEYDINIYLKDWSAESLSTVDPLTNAVVASSATIGLYKLSGEASLSEYLVENQDFSSALSEANSVSYAKSTVASGTYNFVVSFSYNGKSFSYSDKIIILPFQKTSATVAIPDILQVVPAAPSDFKQGYLIPSTDESDYYRVCFEWEDNSKTETCFEIQFLDVSENENATASSLNNENFWNVNASSLNTISYTSSFDGSSDWYAGSLGRDSTNAIFYVTLGKRYYARIRALNNDVGGSAWAYASSDSVSVTVPQGSATAESASLLYAKTFNSTSFHTPVINLFRLKYNLSGGSLSPTIKTLYYFDQIVGGNPVLCPDGGATSSAYNSGAAVSLVNGSLTWKNWAVNAVSGSAYQNSFTRCTSAADYDANTTYYVPWAQEADINGSAFVYEPASPQPTEFTDATYGNYYTNDGTPANYVGYKNLSLYAVYEDSNTAPIVDDYSIKSNLTFTASVDGSSVTISNNFFEIPASSTNLSLAYNYVTTLFEYDYVSLVISENGGSEIGTYSVTGQTFSIPTSIFESSCSYILTFKASKSGSTYTSTFFMNAN